MGSFRNDRLARASVTWDKDLHRLMTSQKLRNQMPVTAEYAYFDHAAVAPLPQPARLAMDGYTDQCAAHGDALWLTWARRVESLRGRLAQMLGAQAEEIALVPNTTHGINFIAQGIPWQVGDNLVVPENEFPSNMLAWQTLDDRGVEIRKVAVVDGRFGADDIRPLLDERTRLVALSWVGYATGFRADIETITDLAHGRGIPVMLDAIQGLGALPLDISRVPADFVCADGHKWLLGPEGAGFLYVRKEHLNWLKPVGIGWNSLKQGAFEPVSDDQDWRALLKSTAARFEGGTTNMAGMHGLDASVELLLDSGLRENPSRTESAILENVGQIESTLRSRQWTVRLPELHRERSGILRVMAPDSADTNWLAGARKFLLRKKVVTSVRGGGLRISTHAYNNRDDITKLVDALEEFRGRHA